MILDTLENAKLYAGTHRGLKKAFAWIRKTDLEKLTPGIHAIDGKRLFANVVSASGAGRKAAKLEVHRTYIDIQLTIAGNEVIGWRPLAECARPAGRFNAKKDLGFYKDAPAAWLPLPPGTFGVFFPEDAHAPMAGRGRLRKVIVKVALGRR